MKILKWVKNRWKAETPLISQLAQILSGVISATFALWSTMPEEFKGIFTATELKAIAFTAIITAVLLQLTKSKDK